MKLFKKAKKGFTLVELVVVIAVIAILAAVSVGAYFGVTESANQSQADQEAKALHTSIMLVVSDPENGYTVDADGTLNNGVKLNEFVADIAEVTGLTYNGENEPKIELDDNGTVRYTTVKEKVRYINVKTGAIAEEAAKADLTWTVTE